MSGWKRCSIFKHINERWVKGGCVLNTGDFHSSSHIKNVQRSLATAREVITTWSAVTHQLIWRSHQALT